MRRFHRGTPAFVPRFVPRFSFDAPPPASLPADQVPDGTHAGARRWRQPEPSRARPPDGRRCGRPGVASGSTCSAMAGAGRLVALCQAEPWPGAASSSRRWARAGGGRRAVLALVARSGRLVALCQAEPGRGWPAARRARRGPGLAGLVALCQAEPWSGLSSSSRRSARAGGWPTCRAGAGGQGWPAGGALPG